MIDPRVMWFDHHDMARAVTAHAFRFALVRLWHLPGHEIHAIRRKLLHAAGHIDDVKVIQSIERQRARLVELSERRPARADDLDRAEELALERKLVSRRGRLATGGNKRKQGEGEAEDK